MNDRFWTRFFIFCAVWNLVIGLGLAFYPTMSAANMNYTLPRGSWLFIRMAGVLIAIFGIGYAMVSTDLDRHRSLIVLGLVSKIAVALLFIVFLVLGNINTMTFLAGASDLIFAAFFMRFLTRYPAR